MTTPAAAPAMKLSPDQQRIIGHRGNHLQVIACAGSGKTETVARRVAGLIAEGVAPSSIVAFTFTNAAAASLKSRIHARVKDQLPGLQAERLSPMYVGTIHAFCLRFLQENAPRYATFDLFETHQVVALLLREYNRIGLDRLGAELGERNLTKVVSAFLETAEVVDNELLDPAVLPRTAFAEVYVAWRQMLEGYHVLTHNQCIARAVASLDDPAIFARYHAGLRHLIVDEFQDINPAQAALIERLGRDPVEVCVVGDDDQAIYQWRGSNVGTIQSFQKRMGSASASLVVNRRSRAGIVGLAAEFAKSISPRIAKNISAGRKEGPLETHRFIAPDVATEAELIADAIVTMHAKGTPYAAVAVLLRSVSTSSGPLLSALEARGVPLRCAGTNGLFLQPDARALGLAFLVLGGRSTYFDASTHRVEPISAASVAAELGGCFSASPPAIQRWLERMRDGLPKLRSVDLVGTLYELFSQLGVSTLDPAVPADAARLSSLARFSQLLADFESASRRMRRVLASGQASGDGDELRGASSDAERAFRQLANYIGYYAQSAYEDAGEELGFDVDAVTVTTIHQAKGLEWPVVFVPCLSAARFPSRMTGKPRNWLVPRTLFGAERYEGTEADERRLLYVAVTRAREHLYVSTHAAVTTRAVKPSPFFLALGGAGVKVSGAPLPVPAHACAVHGPGEERPTMSFSELASWLRCPMSYRLRLELGFQPRAAKELGYGKAVHHVLRRLAEETQLRGRVPTATRVAEIFDREFFLPWADQPALRTMRAAAERLVRRYLEHHADDLLHTWSVERTFELQLPEAHVTGRADVIVDAGRSLSLVDYKTRTGDDVLFAIQLAAYAAAASGEGLKVERAFVHDLSAEPGKARTEVPVDHPAQLRARKTLAEAASAIRGRRFHAKPSADCRGCDVRQVCGSCPAKAR